MQPLVLRLHRGLNAELRRRFGTVEPDVQQMLFLVLRGIALDKTDMRTHLVPVVAEVDELADLIGIVRLVCREHGDDGVRAYAVERVRVASDDALQRVLLHDARLERLLVLRLARHGRLRHDDRRARPDCQRIQQVLDEGKLVLLRVRLGALGIGRVHQADRRALQLHLRRVLAQEVAALQVAVAILAQNHVRGCHGEHVALKLIAVELLLLDVLLLRVRICQHQHPVHGRNQESRRATSRVEHRVSRLYVHQLAHQVADVAGRQDDAQRLPVTARIAHKLAVEAPDEVLAGLLVLDVTEHVLVQELRVEFQRRLAQRLVYLVQAEAGLQDGELRQQLVLLRIRPHVGARQAGADCVHQLVAVAVSRQLVAGQRANRKTAELNLVQRQKDARHHQRLVLVLQRAVCTQVLMQLRRILQNLLRGLLDVGRLLQDVARVILVDVLLGKRDERLDVRQLLVTLAVIHPQRRDDVVLRVAGDTDGEHLLERGVLRYMLRVEIRAVHGVIGHGLHARVDDARIGQLNLLVHIGLVLNDENEIADDSRIFRVPGVAGPTLRSAFQRLVDFLHIAALCIETNLALVKLGSYPKVGFDLLLCHLLMYLLKIL